MQQEMLSGKAVEMTKPQAVKFIQKFLDLFVHPNNRITIDISAVEKKMYCTIDVIYWHQNSENTNEYTVTYFSWFEARFYPEEDKAEIRGDHRGSTDRRKNEVDDAMREVLLDMEDVIPPTIGRSWQTKIPTEEFTNISEG